MINRCKKIKHPPLYFFCFATLMYAFSTQPTPGYIDPSEGQYTSWELLPYSPLLDQPPHQYVPQPVVQQTINAGRTIVTPIPHNKDFSVKKFSYKEGIAKASKFKARFSANSSVQNKINKPNCSKRSETTLFHDALTGLVSKPHSSKKWTSDQYLLAMFMLYGELRPMTVEDIAVYNPMSKDTRYLAYNNILAIARRGDHYKRNAFCECLKKLKVYEKIIDDVREEIAASATSKKKSHRCERTLQRAHAPITPAREQGQKTSLQEKADEQRSALEAAYAHCLHMQEIYAMHAIGEHCDNIDTTTYTHSNAWMEACKNPHERFERRKKAFEEVFDDNQHSVEKRYPLPYCIQQAVHDNPACDTFNHANEHYMSINGHTTPTALFYTQCYGNQLQQVVHEECLSLLDMSQQTTQHNILYAFRGALNDCTDAAISYNHAGETAQSLRIIDFCWAVVDYSKQIGSLAFNTTTALAKGIGTGVIDSVVPTGLYLAFGNYYVAAQVGMLLAQGVRLGVNACQNPDIVWNTWKDCKKNLDQLSNFELLEKGTACATTFFAPKMLCSGIRKLGKALTSKIADFTTKNPISTPADFMRTPEGVLLKGLVEEKIPSNTTLPPLLIGKKYKSLSGLTPLGKGSTGRSTPNNLTEKLALESIVANPTQGNPIALGQGMTDIRWHKTDGWLKMSWNSHGIEIHYVAQVRDSVIVAVDDFKFKERIIRL